jgi:alkanesulfonate monooxygenase SsuD/methylene tetrahydromethanopterin reductase-like flavin-dependent oxidoreductase (luciferase family)
VDVCKALWASIDSDALVLDPETGLFADPEKVHPIDHSGRFFESAGPLSVLPSPQGRPLLIQAGGSPQGNAFAARNSDVQYAGSSDRPDAWQAMRRQRDLLDEECRTIGRDPSDLKLIFNSYPIIGDTVEEAEQLVQTMRSNITDEAALAYMSHNTTYDYSTLEDGTRIEDLVHRIEDAGGSRGGPIHALMRQEGADFTIDKSVVAEMGRDAAVPSDLVGTPGMVADRLQELWERGGGDGFAVNLRPSMRDSVGIFVDKVIPILQERGVFRKDYDEHETLRSRLSY